MSKGKGKTAAELMAELTRDPEYVAQRRQRDDERRRKEEEYVHAEAPLVKELRQAGIEINSVWELVNSPNTHAQSLPLLLEHLQRPYPDAVREGIARAMAVPSAKFAWPILVRLYQEVQEPRTKDGLAVAISAIADRESIDEVIRLIRDERHGASRILLLGALGKLALPQARKVLMDLGGDPALQKEARRLLRCLK
jgi:hypothetical protein